MRNFQGTFETPKRSFINAFSICVTVPLKQYILSLPRGDDRDQGERVLPGGSRNAYFQLFDF